MTQDNTLTTLKEAHAALDRKIQEEEARPRPDEILLHGLKREKLELKDKIADLAD